MTAALLCRNQHGSIYVIFIAKMVIHSIEDETGIHCVDVARDTNGTFTFKVFRRDPEDEGRWTLVGDYSKTVYATETDALAAAGGKIPWMKDIILKRFKQL
jgi:hypothetical protein